MARKYANIVMRKNKEYVSYKIYYIILKNQINNSTQIHTLHDHVLIAIFYKYLKDFNKKISPQGSDHKFQTWI